MKSDFDYMYSEEIEFQVKKRRTLALLYNQLSKFFHSVKELSILLNSLFKEQNNYIQSSLE